MRINPAHRVPDPEAAGCARRAALASRTNTLFSIPMLFYLGAATHYQSLAGGASAGTAHLLLIIASAIIVVVELNCLVGTQGATKKPLDSVSGTLWAGFILTAVLYVLFLIII